jgi:hypothetical protein
MNRDVMCLRVQGRPRVDDALSELSLAFIFNLTEVQGMPLVVDIISDGGVAMQEWCWAYYREHDPGAMQHQ